MKINKSHSNHKIVITRRRVKKKKDKMSKYKMKKISMIFQNPKIKIPKKLK